MSSRGRDLRLVHGSIFMRELLFESAAAWGVAVKITQAAAVPITAILFGVLAIGGTLFFDIPGPGASVEWRAPWLLLCTASALTFPLTPVWALLQGCGQINEVNRYRFIDAIGRSLVLWSGISAGSALWAAGLSALFSAFLAACFLLLRHRWFLASLFAGFDPSFSLHWWREVFPLQWRIAVSWISGFFAFYLFTPTVFYFSGPEAAGQMGITWAVASGISALASTWAQTRAPQFARLVAERKFEELDRQAKHIGIIGVVVSLACGLAAMGALVVLQDYSPSTAARFLPFGPVVLFLGSDVLHQISVTQATYLRARRYDHRTCDGYTNLSSSSKGMDVSKNREAMTVREPRNRNSGARR